MKQFYGTEPYTKKQFLIDKTLFCDHNKYSTKQLSCRQLRYQALSQYGTVKTN